jgi:hypothetical protein
VKKLFSILFALVLVVSLELATALVLADVSPGWTNINQVAAGGSHTVGVKDDGTAVAVGYNASGQCNVGGWTNITQVAAGNSHTVGRRSDSTVVAVGYNYYGQCNVFNWTGITWVAAGNFYTLGCKTDGTVVAMGRNDYGQCNVGNWTGIIQVAAGAAHSVGLTTGYTVFAVGWNNNGQCNVGNWTNIAQVAAADQHTVGLKYDFTVVAVGLNTYGQCNVSGWTGITQIAAGGQHTVGLKSDGTVVAVGRNDYGQCNVSGWTNITRVAAGGLHTVGLRNDGTVVAVGNNEWGQCGHIVTETVTNSTVDAKDEADTEVAVNGTAKVTVYPYDHNPGGPPPTGFGSLGKYCDVHVPNITQVAGIEIRLYYTDAELAAKGIDNEELLRPLWWDGAEWDVCSDSGVNTASTNGYSGYMWAKITNTTTPSLDDLQGLPVDQGYESGGELPSKGCFIATAAYGTDTAREIDILREFRDTVLLTNSLGIRFVSLYYKISPPIADFISQHEFLRTMVRVGFVDPIVRILSWTHGLWSA